MKVSAIHEKDGYVEVQCEGPFSIALLGNLVKGILEASERVDGKRLLLNLRGVTGTPSTMDRYQMGLAASRLPKGLRIAAVTQSELIDPEKFGEKVAQNRGADLQVFDDERAAIAWLLEDARPPAVGAPAP